MVVGVNTLTAQPLGGENVNFAVSAADVQPALWGPRRAPLPLPVGGTGERAAAGITPIPARDQKEASFLALAELIEKNGSADWTPVVGVPDYEADKVARVVAPIAIDTAAHKITCTWECRWTARPDVNLPKYTTKHNEESKVEIPFRYERGRWFPDWENSTERGTNPDPRFSPPCRLFGDAKQWFVDLLTPYITEPRPLSK